MENKININLNGQFYSKFSNENNYSPESQKCIEETVYELLNQETNANKPGILLGKVQSGKTRAFIGIMALGFDNHYDIVVVLTKGTKALARQTLRRLREEFNYFINVTNEVRVYDIMAINDNLTKYNLNKKLIFVVKKEDDNMRRLEELFFNNYPDLAARNILIIDDEADFASIGFSSSKEFGLKMNVIASQISNFRKQLSNRCDLLQVTATPYSLYLQPEEIVVQGEVFQPIRPAFTKLVPIHDKYVGGKEYFEMKDDETLLNYHLWEEVPEKELEVFSKPHGSYLNNIMTSESLSKFREAIINFIVGASIRRIQNKKSNEKESMYSFIMHTDVSKAKHNWQAELVSQLKMTLEEYAKNGNPLIKDYIKVAYDNLSVSLLKFYKEIPSFDEVTNEVMNAMLEEYLGIYTVNSDSDIETLLNDNGQLSLENPFNIFIGGQILDRGITIENLIGFFYGRNPHRFQLDTVLQHSRMYGARPAEDMAVTRFYTTNRIYDAMSRMHEIDCALRDGFENNQFDKGVIFIQKDSKHQIRPCSPNKILLSDTMTLLPSARVSPKGFNTTTAPVTKKAVEEIDEIMRNYKPKEKYLIDASLACVILKMISKTFEFEEGYYFDWESFTTTLAYLSGATNDSALKGKIYMMHLNDRNARRKDKLGRFNVKPESTSAADGLHEGGIAKQDAVEIPFLLLLRQNGIKGEGLWKGNPFWWPVVYMPQKMKPLIYSTEKMMAPSE
jgi:hypothetical protein